MSNITEFLKRAGIRDRERLAMVDGMLDGMRADELQALADEFLSRAGAAKEKEARDPVRLYEKRRAAAEAKGVSFGNYVGDVGRTIMSNWNRDDAGPLLDSLAEERQALVLAGAIRDESSWVYGPGVPGSNQTVMRMGRNYCTSEEGRIAWDKDSIAAPSVVHTVFFDGDGKLKPDVYRSWNDCGPRRVTAYDELHAPSVKGEVFRRTLLDLGWPQYTVDSLETQADVLAARQADPSLSELALYGGPKWIHADSSRQAGMDSIYLKRVRSTEMAPGRDASGQPVFTVPVDIPSSSGTTGRGLLTVPKDAVRQSTRRQGDRDVPNQGFSDVRLGSPDGTLRVAVAGPGGTMSAKWFRPEELVSAREAAREAATPRKGDRAAEADAMTRGLSRGAGLELSSEGIV